MPRELPNRESRAAHLRDLRHGRAALSAPRRPKPHASRAEAGAHRRRRDAESRRDPVRPDARPVRRFEVRVGDTVTDRLSRQTRPLRRRGELAPGQDEVADRELLVDVTFDDALVDALVVPAHDHQMRELREPPRRRLVEEGALRAHENDATALAFCRAYSAGEGFGFEDHPGTATVRRVIHDVMTISRPLPDVMDRQLDLAGDARTRDDAFGERALEHL